MTDHSNEIDPAERIRQLQARRAASGRTPRTPKRRGHPAAATRWLLGGLSIVSFVGIAGTVAVASSPPAATVSAPAATAAPVSAAVAATPVPAKATSATASTAQVAHTRSGGS